MGSAEGEGGKEVGAFGRPGGDGPEPDRPRAGRQFEEPSFRVGFAGHHHALAVVGIHGVGRERDGFGGGRGAPSIGFGEDVIADHAPGFPDVKLGRPVAMAGILVRRQTPRGHFGFDVGRNPGIGAQEFEEAPGVFLVRLGNLRAPGLAGRGPLVTVADPVAGHALVGIPVGFPVGHPVGGADVVEDSVGEGGQIHRATGRCFGREEPADQFVIRGVVVRWGRDGYPVAGLGQAEAVVVGLDKGIGSARSGGRSGTDPRDESAGGISRIEVGIDRQIDEDGGGGSQDTVPGFTVGGIGFPADPEADPRGGQQVTLIGGIEIHPGADHEAGAGFDFADGGAGFSDGAEWFIQQGRHRSGREQVLEDSGSGFGFEEILPGGGTGEVFTGDPEIKLGGKAADGIHIAFIGGSQPPAAHAPNVAPGVEEDNVQSVAGSLRRGDDATRGRPVDAEIAIQNLPGRGGGGDAETK